MASQRLSGKTAFVTGSAQGIGRACAEALAREGAQVIATDIDELTLATLRGPTIETSVLDVADAAAIRRIAADVGPVNVVVNVAGIVHEGSILDCDDEEWDRTFAVNAKSVHRVTRAFLPRLIDSGGGSIINIASVHGFTRGGPGRYVYAATKGAISALTRATALDLIKMNVRCNAIAPGPIESPSFLRRFNDSDRFDSSSTDGPALQRMTAMHPAGRVGRPDEVAPYAVFLASDESSYITGTTQLIDGGWSL